MVCSTDQPLFAALFEQVGWVVSGGSSIAPWEQCGGALSISF